LNKNSYIINVGRGETINEEDLYEALNETMGMPSKEEFEQIVKDMEDSGTYANGGLASIGV